MMLDQIVRDCIGNGLVVVVVHAVAYVGKDYTPTKWKQGLTLLMISYSLRPISSYACIKNNGILLDCDQNS